MTSFGIRLIGRRWKCSDVDPDTHYGVFLEKIFWWKNSDGDRYKGIAGVGFKVAKKAIKADTAMAITVYVVVGICVIAVLITVGIVTIFFRGNIMAFLKRHCCCCKGRLTPTDLDLSWPGGYVLDDEEGQDEYDDESYLLLPD